MRNFGEENKKCNWFVILDMEINCVSIGIGTKLIFEIKKILIYPTAVVTQLKNKSEG